MSGGVPAGERREEIADIIADHVSGPVVQDWDIQQAHRQDQLTAADKIAALFANPTPPIEGRDADVERVLTVLRNLEAACDDLAANRSQETYRNMVDCDRATPYLHALDDARRDARAALQALGDRP